jgi:hypothetical protein
MKHLFIAVITISLVSVTFDVYAEGSSDRVSSEEYAIYSAILNQVKISPSDGKRARLLVVNDRTSGPVGAYAVDSTGKCKKEFMSPALKPLLENMRTRNWKEYPLGRRFNVTRNYVLLSSKGFSDFFNDSMVGGWDDYYRKYPHGSGRYTFSRVGFDPGGKKAVVFVEVSCNVMCGYFTFVLLNKVNGKWKIASEYDCNSDR